MKKYAIIIIILLFIALCIMYLGKPSLILSMLKSLGKENNLLFSFPVLLVQGKYGMKQNQCMKKNIRVTC